VTDPDWQDDPHMRDAALLGAIEGDLLRRGYPQARQLMKLTAGLMDRIEELEAYSETLREARHGTWWMGYNAHMNDTVFGTKTPNPYKEPQ
jgi:hypothetical protein